VRIACIGGGPAGLYLGILIKRGAPEHDVVVYERNRPADTFGFGVVFSDATLGHLAAADPQTHAQITAKFARWDDIEIHVGGEVLRSTGHGFCGLERKTLLQILQARAQELGVRVEFEHEIASLSEVTADVVVACDGVASWVRDALAAELRPQVDVRPNKFVWLGCTMPYDAFTFIFKQTPFGLFRVHAYRYQATGSTFIVECREDTWRAAGLANADEDRTLAILGGVFAAELEGHQLIKNRSIWRNFPTVRCGKWHAGNVVLLGDAAHTAHFSIGSGTKLAMEDAIVLRDELLAHRDVPAALAAYEAKRRPEVEALQAAAQASLEWFEGTERYMKMAPVQFTYSLMTRSLRVSHASVAKRDPHLARGVELLLAASVGITPDKAALTPARGDHRVAPPAHALPLPTELPCPLGDRRARSRIVLAPLVDVVAAHDGDEPSIHAGDGLAGDHELVELGAGATSGAGLVVTPAIPVTMGASPRINTDDQAVAWHRVVEYVHGKGALIVARIATTGAVPGALEAAVQRAAYADFDVLLLDPGVGHGSRPDDLGPGADASAIEHLPAMVAVARTKWRARGFIAVAVHDRPTARAAVVGHAAQLVRAGANLLWVTSAGDAHMAGARLPAAPLADRLRNELAVATAVDGADALLPDLDAAVGAGRADLVVVRRMPAGSRR
jgi:anthraniloyl-CoA monooxygenase